MYEKPWQTRTLLASLIGRGSDFPLLLSPYSSIASFHRYLLHGRPRAQASGLLVICLTCHLPLSLSTPQRRLIAPAFTLQSVKAVTPVFFQKAEELCHRWDSLIEQPFMTPEICPSDPPPAYAPVATASEKFRGVTIDIAHWLARASFDVVGLAGFGYRFNALERETEGVYLAFRRMLDVADKGPQTLRSLMELFFPILRKIYVSFKVNVQDYRTSEVTLPSV